MKTNRTHWLRRLAFIVGTVWVATQASANVPATAAPAPQTTQATPVQAGAEQPRVVLASAGCTRVGDRMVC